MYKQQQFYGLSQQRNEIIGEETPSSITILWFYQIRNTSSHITHGSFKCFMWKEPVVFDFFVDWNKFQNHLINDNRVKGLLVKAKHFPPLLWPKHILLGGLFTYMAWVLELFWFVPTSSKTWVLELFKLPTSFLFTNMWNKRKLWESII